MSAGAVLTYFERCRRTVPDPDGRATGRDNPRESAEAVRVLLRGWCYRTLTSSSASQY